MMNKAVLFTAAAALAEQAMAFNSHRHHHNVDKRALHTNWVTVWETVYITPGQAAPAFTPAPVVEKPAPEALPTTTSTTVVVIPSNDNGPVANAPAPVQPTTLVPVVKESTTSEKPAATKVSVESSSGGVGFSKRGMAYNDANLANSFGSSCTKCGWAYNWDSEARGLDSKYSYVPMLWDDTEKHTGRWNTNCDKSIADGAKAILSFNEPDHAGQAAMTPERAASSHVKYLNPYAGKVLIGAPAVTNSGNPGEGLKWLESFMTACSSAGCQIDFCPVHWYSEAQYADTLFTHLENAHKICGGKPIWLTEFAPLGDAGQISSFLKENLAALDSLDYLHAYSYFMVADGNLMSGTSSLSSFGQIYASN